MSRISRVALHMGDGKLRSLFKFWFRYRVLGLDLNVEDVKELFSTLRDYLMFKYYGLSARRVLIVGRSYLLFTNSDLGGCWLSEPDSFEVLEPLEELVETYSRLYKLVYTPSFINEELNMVTFYDDDDYSTPLHEDAGLLIGVNDDGRLFSNIVLINEYVDRVREVVYNDGLIAIYRAEPSYFFVGVKRPVDIIKSVGKWYRVQGDLLIRLNNVYGNVDEFLERLVGRSFDLILAFETLIEDIVERLYARLGFSVEADFSGKTIQVEARLIDDRGLRAGVVKKIMSRADKMVIEGLNNILNNMLGTDHIIDYRRTYRKLSRAGTSNRIISFSETFITRTYRAKYMLKGIEVYEKLFKKRIAESLRNRVEFVDTVIVHGNHWIKAKALSLAGALELSRGRVHYVRTDHGVYEINLGLGGEHRTYVIIDDELEVEHPEHGSKKLRFDQCYKGLLKEISIGNTIIHRDLNEAFTNTSLIRSVAERGDLNI